MGGAEWHRLLAALLRGVGSAAGRGTGAAVAVWCESTPNLPASNQPERPPAATRRPGILNNSGNVECRCGCAKHYSVPGFVRHSGNRSTRPWTKLIVEGDGRALSKWRDEVLPELLASGSRGGGGGAHHQHQHHGAATAAFGEDQGEDFFMVAAQVAATVGSPLPASIKLGQLRARTQSEDFSAMMQPGTVGGAEMLPMSRYIKEFNGGSHGERALLAAAGVATNATPLHCGGIPGQHHQHPSTALSMARGRAGSSGLLQQRRYGSGGNTGGNRQQHKQRKLPARAKPEYLECEGCGKLLWNHGPGIASHKKNCSGIPAEYAGGPGSTMLGMRRPVSDDGRMPEGRPRQRQKREGSHLEGMEKKEEDGEEYVDAAAANPAPEAGSGAGVPLAAPARAPAAMVGAAEAFTFTQISGHQNQQQQQQQPYSSAP